MKRVVIVLMLLSCNLAVAEERILSFDADILVHADGTIDVTETTVVRVEGYIIKRGIVREFPTRYTDRLGNDVVVKMQPLSALRNDELEDFHTDSVSNGLSIRFGDRDRFLEHGVHTYQFRYRVSRVLGYFDDRDELYWNVTGLDSRFPIDSATATIQFNFDISGDELGIDAFTGRYGSSDKDYSGRAMAGGKVEFATTGMLRPGAGMTVVVNWPKGYTPEPTAMDKMGYLLADNLNLLIALLGLLAVFAYYMTTWSRFGRDPPAGVVFTRYTPPEDFSPASLRYIRKMRHDQTAMTAAVVNLAVKGYLRIAEDDGEHTLTRLDPGHGAPALAAGESALYEALFSEGNEVVLTNDNHGLVARAAAAHGQSLNRDYANRYFRINGLMNLPGIGIGISSMIVAFSVGSGATPLLIAIAIAMFVVAVVFAILLRQPTGLGRTVLDAVDGFREYLEIAEKDEMNLRNPPKKTPELFEMFLPYALAIGVQQAWSEKFVSVFAGLANNGATGYSPAWYSGNWDNSRLVSTTDSISSGLSTSISSAATPPGSSSGSGGGGFSGGGGGGGGTGGW
jgi:uncharacterized protein (TIGR04222 family)